MCLSKLIYPPPPPAPPSHIFIHLECATNLYFDPKYIPLLNLQANIGREYLPPSMALIFSSFRRWLDWVISSSASFSISALTQGGVTATFSCSKGFFRTTSLWNLCRGCDFGWGAALAGILRGTGADALLLGSRFRPAAMLATDLGADLGAGLRLFFLLSSSEELPPSEPESEPDPESDSGTAASESSSSDSASSDYNISECIRLTSPPIYHHHKHKSEHKSEYSMLGLLAFGSGLEGLRQCCSYFLK
jgi:hypothetical protein